MCGDPVLLFYVLQPFLLWVFPFMASPSVGAVTWGESKAGKQRGHFLPKTVCKRRGNAMGAGLKESM